MQFIYKNLTVQLIINLDANVIMAICKGNDSSKFKTGIKDGETIKTVDYKDLGSINFTINVPIDSNKKVFSFDHAGENLYLNLIMKKICKKIDEQIV